MNDLLISADDLARQPAIRIFDCRHDLADPARGRRLFDAGHIPGAVHAHIDADLSGTPNGSNGRHPLPDRKKFLAWLGSVGLKETNRVVAYDEGSGAFAARLWWLLRWVGHRKVSLLDGGLEAWKAAGLPLQTEVRDCGQASYDSGQTSMPTADLDDVVRNLDSRNCLVIDARAAGRFAGVGETIDPVGGHIPGALNRPFTDNLSEGGMFKPPSDLRSEFAQLIGGMETAAVIQQCGSGVTACHNLFAMELAGLSGSRLYPGSWSEWCSSPDRPVAIG
jgi:thiosulfate/3-mercaptopyruvate sulfurtransferase